MNSLSDFDLILQRLDHWGHWGRDDCGRPDPEAGCGSIYQLGKADERDLDEDAAPDVRRKINVKDCEFLDVLIANKIGRENRNIVKDYFYKRRFVPILKVHAAVRALLDAEYVAKELGWAA